MINNIFKYKKIILIGSAGSGKSYLAKEIANITKYPLTHLDNKFWLPNWNHVEKDKWIKMQQEMVNEDCWVIDGNYNGTMEIRFQAADLVIFLDINRVICIYSAIKRHGKKRSDLPEYLDESFGKDFYDFLKWIYSFKKTGRVKIMNLHNKYPETKFIILKSRRQIKRFIDNIIVN